MADIIVFPAQKQFDTEVALAAIQKLKRELEAQYGGITNEDWTRIFLAELIAHTAAGGHNPADYFTILGQETQVYEPGDKVFEYL